MIVAMMPTVGVPVLFSTHVKHIVHPDMVSRSRRLVLLQNSGAAYCTGRLPGSPHRACP